MPRYLFNIQLAGEGDTPEDAWVDAINAFAADPGATPENYEKNGPRADCGIDGGRHHYACPEISATPRKS